MASSVVDCGSCVACGSAFVGHHRAMCQTCDGNLCEWCFGAHARTPTPPALRGHVFEESSFERDRAALLIMFGLAAPAKVCGTHGKPLVFACASHGGSAPTVTGSTVESDSTISRVLLCTECISEHKGHDLISIDRHAKSVRALLGGVVAEQRPADLVRAVAVRTAVGIDMLPQLVASAHEQAVVARDALIAAVKERFDDVKAQIDAAASGSEAVLTAHLRANDVILDRATALAAGLRRATDYFDDIDIATYGGVLLAEVRKLNADATRIAATPETPPFIAFSVGTSLDDVALAVRRLGIVTRSPEEATAAEIVHASFPRLEEATAAARAEADKCRTRMSTAEAALEAARRESVAERAAEKRRLAENEMAIAKRIADADERAAAATARIVLLEEQLSVAKRDFASVLGVSSELFGLIANADGAGLTTLLSRIDRSMVAIVGNLRNKDGDNPHQAALRAWQKASADEALHDSRVGWDSRPFWERKCKLASIQDILAKAGFPSYNYP